MVVFLDTRYKFRQFPKKRQKKAQCKILVYIAYLSHVVYSVS